MLFLHFDTTQHKRTPRGKKKGMPSEDKLIEEALNLSEEIFDGKNRLKKTTILKRLRKARLVSLRRTDLKSIATTFSKDRIEKDEFVEALMISIVESDNLIPSPRVRRKSLGSSSGTDWTDEDEEETTLNIGDRVIISFGKRKGVRGELIRYQKIKDKWLVRLLSGREAGKRIAYPVHKFDLTQKVSASRSSKTPPSPRPKNPPPRSKTPPSPRPKTSPLHSKPSTSSRPKIPPSRPKTRPPPRRKISRTDHFECVCKLGVAYRTRYNDNSSRVKSPKGPKLGDVVKISQRRGDWICVEHEDTGRTFWLPTRLERFGVIFRELNSKEFDDWRKKEREMEKNRRKAEERKRRDKERERKRRIEERNRREEERERKRKAEERERREEERERNRRKHEKSERKRNESTTKTTEWRCVYKNGVAYVCVCSLIIST